MRRVVRQAIMTKYHGPTDTKPAYIMASCDAGKIKIDWDCNLNIECNHRVAAAALAHKFGWLDNGEIMLNGGYANGYFWVFEQGDITYQDDVNKQNLIDAATDCIGDLVEYIKQVCLTNPDAETRLKRLLNELRAQGVEFDPNT